MSNENTDLEAPLNSFTLDLEFECPFICKVYLLLTLELVITVAIAAAVAFVQPIFNFFTNPWAGWGFYTLTMIVLIIVLIMLAITKDKYILSSILLVIFSLCAGLALGLVTTFISGVVIVEAGITVIVVVVSLIAYAFLASWRDQDFGFLIPFLLSIIVTVALYTIYQIYFPMGSIAYVICSGLIVLILSAFMIFETNTTLEDLFFSDKYILASIMIYVGMINITRLAGVVRVFCCR